VKKYMNDTDTAAPIVILAVEAGEISHFSNGQNDAPNPVISTEAEGSGEISHPDDTGGMAAGVLSAQSLMSPRGSSHTGRFLRSR